MNPADPTPPGLSRLEGSFAVLMTLIGWSSVPLFLRYFADEIDVWTSNGWRYGFSAILWAPVLILGALRRGLPPGLWRASFIPGLVNSIGQVFFASAHYFIDPGLITFSLRLQILFVVAGALILFPSERRIIRSGLFIVGMGLVMSGAGATMIFADSDEARNRAVHVGVPLAIAAGVFFAAYSLSVRYYMHAYRPIIAFAAISQYTAGAMIALMLMFGQRAGLSVLGLTPNQIAMLLFSSFIGIALGHVCYYTAIARLGVAISSGILQLQPFLATVGSMILFGEVLNSVQWGGGFVAVCGAALVLLAQHRISRRKSPFEPPPPAVADLPADHVAAACAEAPEESRV